jgi:phosphoribosyl-AMP cyclohydrolase
MVEETSSSNPDAGPDFARGDGLLPAIVQDDATGEVLMLAYMNAAAYAETLATGQSVFFSRSRGRLWRKGEESGRVQMVRAIFFDCDADAILLRVEQVGEAACHTGRRSCFYRQATPSGVRIVSEPLFDPAEVYGKGPGRPH